MTFFLGCFNVLLYHQLSMGALQFSKRNSVTFYLTILKSPRNLEQTGLASVILEIS